MTANPLLRLHGIGMGLPECVQFPTGRVNFDQPRKIIDRHIETAGIVHLRHQAAVGDSRRRSAQIASLARPRLQRVERSEEHTSELQSLMRNPYAVFRLKKKNTTRNNNDKK